jgi:hypothetical protein
MVKRQQATKLVCETPQTLTIMNLKKLFSISIASAVALLGYSRNVSMTLLHLAS